MRPRSIFQHLFAFNAADPATKASPAGASPAQVETSHALISKIAGQIENLGPALLNDQGGKENAVQAAINIFGDATGVSPVLEDVSVLTKLVEGAIQRSKAVKGSSPPPAPVPAVASTVEGPSGSGVTTITFTITVQGPGKVVVNQPVVDPATPPLQPVDPAVPVAPKPPPTAPTPGGVLGDPGKP